MTKIQNPKQFDLEDRTQKFAKKSIDYCKKIFKNIAHFEIAKQLIRSAGSVGANFIEANEALSRKDFTLRVKICRKEVKESRYWLNLTEPQNEIMLIQNELIKESTELMKIFGAIIKKSK